MSKKISVSKKNKAANDVAENRAVYFNLLSKNLPEYWTITKLDDLCKIQTGKLDVNQADDGGKYPFFTCAEKIYKINSAAFDTEAVLVAGNGFFNVKYYNGKFNAYQRTYVLSGISIDGKYLYHYIDYRLSDITKDNRGSTIRYIRLGDLSEYPVAVAPEIEQKSIVAEIEKQFSRLDEAVDNLKRVKANLKRYKASILKAAVEGKLTEEWRAKNRDVEPAGKLLERILAERRKKWEEAELAKMEAKGKVPKDDKWKGKYKEPDVAYQIDMELPNGWVIATVKQLSERVQYGSSSKTSESLGDIPVLRMGNIFEGKLLLEKLKYLPESHDEFPELLLEPDDLLFNRTNSPELVGKTAVYKDKPSPCSFASYLIRARFINGVDPNFISYFINSNCGRKWIKSVVSQQVGQANVNGTKLQALSVPLPPYIEQGIIVSEVENNLSIIDGIEKQVDMDLIRAERLRQSVLKKAFSGKLLH